MQCLPLKHVEPQLMHAVPLLNGMCWPSSVHAAHVTRRAGSASYQTWQHASLKPGSCMKAEHPAVKHQLHAACSHHGDRICVAGTPRNMLMRACSNNGMGSSCPHDTAGMTVFQGTHRSHEQAILVDFDHPPICSRPCDSYVVPGEVRPDKIGGA